MLGLRRQNTNIFRSIVELVAVDMMDHLMVLKWPAKHSFGDHDVFIDVAIRVRSWMIRNVNAAIAIHPRNATFPVTIGVALAAGYAGLELIFHRRVNASFLMVLRYFAFCLFRNGMPPHGNFFGVDGLLGLLALPVLMPGDELEKVTLHISTLIIGGFDHVRWLSATAFAKFSRHDIASIVRIGCSHYTGLVITCPGLETA